jgi:FKBP-type peptidyl-prolyl cis-trans isomerase 2
MSAKKGDKVKVHYTGSLDDGTVFDTSKNREPLKFTIGEGQLIPDFEQSIIGLSPGDTKSIHIASENAYGPRREELVLTVSREELPQDFNPTEGQKVQLKQSNGQNVVVTVYNITEKEIKLDANHALAGKDLNFDVELVEIL